MIPWRSSGPNARVKLTNAAGSVLGETASDTQGNVVFQGVEAGDTY
jgi:hypothetical protein